MFNDESKTGDLQHQIVALKEKCQSLEMSQKSKNILNKLYNFQIEQYFLINSSLSRIFSFL